MNQAIKIFLKINIYINILVYHNSTCTCGYTWFTNNISFDTVDSSDYMVGSYGPNKDAYEVVVVKDEAPEGALKRGEYTVKLVEKYAKNIFVLKQLHCMF